MPPKRHPLQFLHSAKLQEEAPSVGRGKRARQGTSGREQELRAENQPRQQHGWLEEAKRKNKLPKVGEPLKASDEGKHSKWNTAADRKAGKSNKYEGSVGKKKAKRLALLDRKKSKQEQKKAAAAARAAGAAADALKAKVKAGKGVELSEEVTEFLKKCEGSGAAGEQHVLAAVADRVTADPMKDLILFEVFFELHQKGNDKRTRQLALLSAVAVFKDLVPGYRIREPTEAEKAVQRSKRVLSLEKHEMTLLQTYRKLLPLLETGMKKEPLVFANALASLVKSAFDFNYRQRLLGTAVKQANIEHDVVRRILADALQEMLEGDQKLEASKEVVLAVGHLAQATAAACGKKDKEGKRFVGGLKTELLSALLHLPIGRAEAAALRRRQAADVSSIDDEVQRQLDEASINKNPEQLLKAEAQLLYEAFVVYLRILRQRHLHPRELLATVLAGLGRWGHQVNVELLVEILAELKRTVEDAISQSDELVAMQGLNCALVLLGGPSKALVTDATWLVESFTRGLALSLPSLHGAYSQSSEWPPRRCFFMEDGRHQASEKELAAILDTESVPALILKCLEAAQDCPQAYGKASDSALATLVEHLCMLSLVADPVVGLAFLREASLLLKKHRRLHTLLDEEGGLFGLGGVVERATTVRWHLHATCFSLCPALARASRTLPTAIVQRQTLIVDLFPFSDSRQWLAAEFAHHLAALGGALPPPAPGGRANVNKVPSARRFLSEADLKASSDHGGLLWDFAGTIKATRHGDATPPTPR